MEKTRGFITIAFGKKYRKLAYNLLMSYKELGIKYPFAVVTDVKDKWTSAFSQVIVAENTGTGFMAKLRINEWATCDQNIFIDADCLIIKDISRYFEMFESAWCGFTVLGRNFPIVDGKGTGGYFDPTKIKGYTFETVPSFNASMYYFDNSEQSKRVFERALEISQSKEDFGFPFYGDEPSIALAMAINGCSCLDNQEGKGAMWLPRVTNVNVDIREQILTFSWGGVNNLSADIIHFATFNTERPFYKKIVRQIKHKNSWLYNFYGSKVVYGISCAVYKIKGWFCRFGRFVKRCFSYLKRKLSSR